MPAFTIQMPGGVSTDPLGPLRFASSLLTLQRQIEAKQERQAALRLAPGVMTEQAGSGLNRIDQLRGSLEGILGEGGLERLGMETPFAASRTSFERVQNLLDPTVMAGLSGAERAARISIAETIQGEGRGQANRAFSDVQSLQRLADSRRTNANRGIRTGADLVKERNDALALLHKTGVGQGAWSGSEQDTLSNIREGILELPPAMIPLLQKLRAADELLDPSMRYLVQAAPPQSTAPVSSGEERELSAPAIIRQQAQADVVSSFGALSAEPGSFLNRITSAPSEDVAALAREMTTAEAEQLLGTSITDAVGNFATVMTDTGRIETVSAMDIYREITNARTEAEVNEALRRAIEFRVDRNVKTQLDFLDFHATNKREPVPGRYPRTQRDPRFPIIPAKISR